jgi:SAM-dependent methyltransferase
MTEVDRTERIRALDYEYENRALQKVDACNLCGSSRHVEVARQDRYGYPAIYHVCARCGLGFLSPRLSDEEYARFYRDTYRPLVSAYHGRRIDEETVQEEQRVYAAELLAFLRDFGVEPRTVLDIGGSTGVVATMVRDAFGAAATVLDPAPAELRVAAAAGVEVVEGFAEHAALDERTFDLVLLCQTVDHLLDVRATLTALRRWVGPQGVAFIDVLDVEFMARRRGSIEGAVKVDHPYYLTRATALGYFAAVGFDIAAERLSEDGHWGFLLTPGDPVEPDWDGLRRAADQHLQLVWSLRAAG